MRKNLFVFLGLAAVTAAASSTAYAAYSAAGTGISGSRHDINAFAKESGMTTVSPDAQERVCAFCHSPHHAYTKDMNGAEAADYLPLWAHELTAKTYEPYKSMTLEAVITDPLYGPSRLCMSCHDGVIAVDTHYQNLRESDGKQAQLLGDKFSDVPAESGAVGAGNSLAGDHPIGFNYHNAATRDDEVSGGLVAGIRPAATSYFRKLDGTPGTIKIQDVLYPSTVAGVTGNNIMTCSSCHEVHNRDNVAQTKSTGALFDTDVNYFLYSYQSGSQICLSCHDK